ncbi:MAG TPA: VWA domain-containing protein [Candidatus Angelobacter sp.]|nr:VWA domain-containing protein [Candidatus Angelobacter sp.]
MKQALAGLERWSLVLCVLLSLRMSATGQGQASPTAPAPQKSAPLPQAPPKSTPAFRVNVRLVNVFATVTDAHGAPIAGLSKDDFSVLEDGVPQTISVFDRESELPLSIALAVDTSESTRRDLGLEVASAKKFVHSVVRPVDRLAVFQITENVDRVTGFTSDLKWIDHGIDNLRVGAGTSLYDAIYLAADELLDREGRRVLVLITDGGDTTSRAGYESALRRAQQAEAIVYSIIVVPIASDAGRNIGGEHALIQISKDTGGKYHYAETLNQLDEAFRQISLELRTQYLIAYYPNRQIADSPFRRIQVQVTKKDSNGMQVRHRAGYYTGPAK